MGSHDGNEAGCIDSIGLLLYWLRFSQAPHAEIKLRTTRQKNRNMKILLLSAAAMIGLVSCEKRVEQQQETEQSSVEKTEKTKKILFVLTSHDELGSTGVKTGFWIEEFATPYYFLKDQGVDITLASPKGGQPPIDPKSELPDFQTPSTVRFNADKETRQRLAKTIKLASVDQADYDAVFYPGGHGPLWDLAEDADSIALIESMIKNGKPVSAVCHAPAIFKNTKNEDGSPLVKGKKVTGFSNTEEEAVQLSNIVPFLVEDMLNANGGIFSKGDDWTPYALEDGLLITGQNPASSELVAEMLLKKLQQ